MEFLLQIISEFKVDLIIGLFLLTLAIIIPVFRLYWLIAGINAASEKDLRKCNKEYLGKFFGLFMGLMGLLIILNPFIFSSLGLKASLSTIQASSIVLIIILMFVVGRINRKKFIKD
jgi:hypothetical protein